MCIFSGNLFLAIKSQQQKNPPSNCHHKNTLAHKLVSGNGIFISIHRQQRHINAHTQKTCAVVYFLCANWLGDYFAWTIRVKHPNDFTVHGHLKSLTFSPCFIPVSLSLHCSLALALVPFVAIVCIGFRRPLKWHLKRMNTIMGWSSEKREREMEEKGKIERCHKYI